MDHAVLGQVALGYSPWIDAQRAVSATRLTVFPQRPDARPDAASLLAAVAEVWPPQAGRVLLNIASEPLLADMLAARTPAHIALEVPAFMAADAQHAQALLAARAAGASLLIKGRPTRELPPGVLACFGQAIVEGAELAQPGALPMPQPPLASGVRSQAELARALQAGAAGALGWPLDDPIEAAPAKAATQPDLATIVELIRRVDQQEPIDRLEASLKLDPALAFKLMRYINSPAFGLRVEIGSFRHAIMMLGYQRLKRWLALLLVSASKDHDMRPVMFAAVRRGLLMEELVRGQGDDEMRGEIFICGVFSLLDRMMKQPFDALLRTIPVPDGVSQALGAGTGPYQPYLELVRAVEQESLFDIRDAAEGLMLSVEAVNRAVLRALATAHQLD
ncbi:HDOD domain-containing protein [Aquincola sp. MAHUQ-54]|uniref:HDOD domain-containing protein n=1 Tax=Aquincola agrisoli TaxID=3119538 RepID=A0AAW9PZ63_9BURK